MAAAFIWAAVETGFFLSSGLRVWTFSDIVMTLGAILGTTMLTSLVVGCTLAVLLFLVHLVLARFRQAPPVQLWERTVNVVMGARGSSLGATSAVIAAYAVLLWILLPSTHQFLLQWSDFPGVLALVVSHAICAVLIGLIYRVVSSKWERWRGYRGIFAAAAAGVVYYLIVGPIREMDPLSLLPFVGVVVCAFALAARIMFEDIKGLGWQFSRLRVVRSSLVVGGLVLVVTTLLFYPPSPSVHSATALQTRLIAPSLELLRLGLDLDGDYFSGQLAGGDCARLDPDIHPNAAEVPGNGVDDNCAGGDLDPEAVPDRPLKLAAPRFAKPATERPDIIFITIDTLRNDHVGKRIAGRSLTPNLDRLAAQSVRFRRTYAPSTHTKETFPSVMTGEYPSDWHHRGLYFGLERTLAEIMGEVGYETLAVSSIPGLRHEIVAGFDDLDNRLAKLNRPRDGVTSAQTTELALSRLDERDERRPFFLWVHYFDPHAYYVQEERLVDWLGEGTQTAGYAHEVARTDEAIGDLLDGLQKRDYLSGSVVAVFSDHGESLNEHNMIGHVWAAYEEIVRVPLLLRLPGVEPGERAQTVSLIDLFPTLVEFLGIEGVEPRTAQSLMPLMRSGEPENGGWEPRPVFIDVSDEGRPLLRAVVDGRSKLVFDRQRHAYSLFDLQEDPHEQYNLISQERQEFERLRALLSTWWDRQFNTARLEQKLRREERLEPTRPDQVSGEFIGPQSN